MKWLIIVVFATVSGDFYIFTNPKFESRQECMNQLKDPDQIYRMVIKIGQEYGRPMPVKAVNCLSEKEIEEILEKTNYKETEKETNV
jgi:hypothetical protein